MASDDEPSDACSRTDGDGATRAHGNNNNNKRKIVRACSYPNKKRASVLTKGSQVSAICALAAVVLMVVYFFMREFEEEDADEEEDDEGDDNNDEEEREEAGGGDEEEHEEDEEEDDEENARLALFNVILECFKTTKAWAERELGPENPILEETLGMLRIIPGFEEAVMKARREAAKAERCLEF